jgi:hypothetical protein
MTQPIHTPGPAQLPTGFRLVDEEQHDGMPLFANGDPFDTIAIVLARKGCNGNARLLAAAYNAFDSAAKHLGVNAVELSERVQEGAIAELFVQLSQTLAAIEATGECLGDMQGMRDTIAKVKGGAS